MADEVLVFVGSLNREAPYFQGARGVGLGVYRFDEATLAVEKLAETGEVDNPSFLSVTGDGRIFANSEVFSWREGVVTAYRFDRATGRLDYVNKQPGLGSITAHNSLTRDGSKLLVANYGEGTGGPDQSVVVYGVRPDGGLTPPLAGVRHEGAGPDPERQERSHAHSVTETVSGGVCIVADLGLDCLATYRIEGDGRLTALARTALAPGAGPRHVALHPGGRFVFVTNELEFDRRGAGARRGHGDAHPHRGAAGGAGGGARGQLLRRYPNLAGRTLPLRIRTAGTIHRRLRGGPGERAARSLGLHALRRRHPAQSVPDPLGPASLLGQPERRRHRDLRPRRDDRAADRHRAADPRRHAHVR